MVSFEAKKLLNEIKRLFSFSYDPDFDRWSTIQPMHFKRLAVGCAVVNRLLYAIGGFDGEMRHNTVECYHPENDAWTMVRPMHTMRSGAGVAVINQFIYVIGGYDGSKQLSTVERYDTEKDLWEFVSSIRIARSALSVTVLDCKIYAMGGYDGQNFLATVEVYDPATDTWVDGDPLTSGRSGHASAVCYQPCMQNCSMGPEVANVANVNNRSPAGNASVRALLTGANAHSSLR